MRYVDRRLPTQERPWAEPRHAARSAVAVTVLVAILAVGGLAAVLPTAGPPATTARPPRAVPLLGPSAPGPAAIPLLPADATLAANVDVGALPAYHAVRSTVAPPPALGAPIPHSSPVLRPVPAAAAPVVALQVAASNVSPPVSLLHTAEGINSNQCGCAPPDVQIAAGPSNEVEMVNLEGAIYDSTGVLQHSFSLSTFFSAGSDFLSDPKVVYDAGTGRWFASILDVSGTPAGFTRVAVSNSSDPNGTWHIYKVAMPSGTFGDQPILGVSSEAIGVSGDIFSLSTGSFDGAAFWVLNKSEAMAGSTNLSVDQYGPDSVTYELHPVQSVSTSPDLYVVMNNYYGVSPSYVSLFDVAGAPPATVTYNETNLTVADVAPGPSAYQPPTSNTLDVGDARIQTAVWRAGTLWLGFTDQCQLPTDPTARSCVRLVEINTTTHTVQQDFDLSRNGTYLYYPALAVAPDGTLSLIVGATSTTLSPSLLVTGRLPADPAGTVLPAIWLIQGSSSLTCGSSPCRYGDYFGDGVVPQTTSFWVAGEYQGSVTNWQTHLGEVQIRGPLGVTLGATPLNLEVGQSVLVSYTLVNSTCGLGTYCTIALPLGAGSYDRTCVGGIPSATLVVNFTTPGTYTVGAGGWVAAYSAAGCAPATETANVSFPSIILTVAPGLTVAIAANPAGTADVAQPITFTAEVSGGATPYSYLWSGLPAGCSATGTVTVSCAPTTTGPATIALSVDDSYGVVRNATLPYWVDAALTASVTATPAMIELGARAGFVASAGGGSGAYSYFWNGLPAGCASQDQPTLTCQPQGTGSFAVNVSVLDTNGGNVTSSSVDLVVLPPVGVSLAAQATQVTMGGSTTFSATVTGGQGPFTYVWTGLPGGCTAANRATLTCTPTSSGTFQVNVTVTDALGGSSSSVVTVTVAAASTGADMMTLYLVLVGVGLVAGVVVGLVLMRRRRRP